MLAAMTALSAGAIAAPAAQAPALPKSCPPASVIGRVLGLKVAHVMTYAGPISSTTLAGMGPAPDSAHYKKTSQTERTCTYSGLPTGPITISFIAPMTADAFSRSRSSLHKTGVAVASVVGIGDTAWAVRAGGLLFVLKGSVDIVISAPRTSVAHLKALAGEIL